MTVKPLLLSQKPNEMKKETSKFCLIYAIHAVLVLVTQPLATKESRVRKQMKGLHFPHTSPTKETERPAMHDTL